MALLKGRMRWLCTFVTEDKLFGVVVFEEHEDLTEHQRAAGLHGQTIRIRRVARQLERLRPDDALRQEAAECGAALAHVLDLVGVLARVVVGRQRLLQRRVRDVQVEPVAELLQLGLGELLHLVGGVAGLEVGAERPALDRVREDHGRLADVLAGRLERRVHLAVVVPAARQLAPSP